MATNIHQTRIWRLFAITGIVALMIFIYATYSSSSSLAPPHMRASSVVSPSADIQFALPIHAKRVWPNRSDEVHNVVEKINEQDKQKVKKLNVQKQLQKHHQHHYRAPTIDVDTPGVGVVGAGNLASAAPTIVNVRTEDETLDDVGLGLISNNLLEEQYLQAVDNTLGNSSNVLSQIAAAADNSASFGKVLQVIESNKLPESDVLIPTSNFQKLIENADKILKNMTASPSTAGASKAILNTNSSNKLLLDNNDITHIDSLVEKSEKQKEQNLQESKQQQQTQVISVDENNKALPPSAVMSIKSESVTPEKTTKATARPKAKPANNDPIHGIPTLQLYESGHMNEEISIEKICPNVGKGLKLLILIMSAPTHTEARLAIRQTWGHFGMRRDVSTAFMLGRVINETQSKALTQENFVYGDLIRGNFIDSYNNLTLKTLSSLEWVDKYCTHTKYVLKTDDDMFINVPKLLSFLDRHAKDKRAIFGRLAQKWKPIRNKKSKYYVSTGQFSASLYPPFTTGPAYVLTSDIVHELFNRAMQLLYLKLEDVYTTGVVAQQLGIRRVHANEFLNRRIAFNACNIRKTISVHMIKANEQYDLWKKLLDQSTKCK